MEAAMGFRSARMFCYALIFAVPGFAQIVQVENEPPHVEVSIGAASIVHGASVDFEREMRALGLIYSRDTFKSPMTEQPNIVPGVFAQAHVALGRHAMVGALISGLETTTTGRDATLATGYIKSDVHTQALMLSYRPNPWFKIGAGPAFNQHAIEFLGPSSTFHDQTFGWVASGEAKFARRTRHFDRPPLYGYVLGQYRHAPSIDLPSTLLPLSGPPNRLLPWPATSVRSSHWMFGLGLGIEI
jgi:hypothetical protein